MLNFTPLVRPFFAYRAARTARIANPEATAETQLRVLRWLLRCAKDTEIGRLYGFGKICDYDTYRRAVPLCEYEDLRPLVMRMLAGERNVLWCGQCRSFAQSSGTSGGKSKYIPLTDDALKYNHYQGPVEAVAAYLNLYSESRLFGGKTLILGGSFSNELNIVPPGVRVGDLSATLIDRINPVINLLRIPGKNIALMEDWHTKLPAIAKAAVLTPNVTNISGVPSWFMAVLHAVMERAGVSSIHDVWKNLEVFFHGGIAFGPYRDQYHSITDPSKMRYSENYNASEGFFAIQDTIEGGQMRLLTNIGVFYEFIDLDKFANGNLECAIPAWQVIPGGTYALVISSCNGLWRYIIGDTVRIESVEPLRISIAGRTNSFINAFGEEVMEWNANTALAKACRQTGAAVANYTAAPVYADCDTKGHHQWLIEWHKPPMCGNEAFADILDKELQAVNSDYEAKRSGDIFLARLELTEAPHGLFNRWLAATGKLGGQRKIPRLSNDRKVIDSILNLK